jgi:hypothetical protein
MSLTISREQHDAVYELVVTRPHGDRPRLDRIRESRHRHLEAADPARCRRSTPAQRPRLGRGDQHERIALTVPPGELVHTLARLHPEATDADALATSVLRPKDEEAVAGRNIAASVALADLLSQLASAPRPADDANGSRGCSE